MTSVHIEFNQFKLTVGQLREKLSNSELAALAVASQCSSEANAHFKLAWLANFKSTGNEVADWLTYNQEAALFRAFTLRLREFWKFLERCQNQNAQVGELARQIVAKYKSGLTNVGFEVADVFRDRVSAHTSMKDAKDALKSVNDEVEVAIFESVERHNSFSTLGEEVFTFGQLSKLCEAPKSRRDYLEAWFEWASLVERALAEFHNELFKQLVVDNFPDISVQTYGVEFPKKLVVSAAQEFQLPVIVENLPQ